MFPLATSNIYNKYLEFAQIDIIYLSLKVCTSAYPYYYNKALAFYTILSTIGAG